MSVAKAFPGTDDYSTSSALGEAEISRLIKTAQAAQFVARDGVPKKTESNFKPRSLVEIAFAAERVRQDAQTSHEQNNMSQPDVSENASSGSNAQTDSSIKNQIEPVAEVPQITEQQAEINALQAQHEANLTELRAELVMQHQLAEKQAYDRGMIAGIEAAKSAEPTEEERALNERRQSEHRDVIARLEACVVSAAGPDAIDDQQLVGSLHSAVIHLASERAGIAIAENPEGISTRIAHLVERVKQKSETVTVALNPEDLTALTAYKAGPLGWRYISDEALLSGDIRVMLDTIDISDVLLSDLSKVDDGIGLKQGDQDIVQVDGGTGLAQGDQGMLQVDGGTDLTQVDQDITQAGVDDVPLEFKIVTTSTDEDAE